MKTKLKTLILCQLLTFTCATPASLGVTPVSTGAHVQVGFSPGNTAQQTVISAIRSAREEILVAAFNFTSKPVASELVDASKRGVIVKVVADAKANDRYTSITFLANQGIPIAVNSRYSYMHNKFMVIDGNSVETGSFNYSAGADNRNAENVIWLTGVPDVAAQYRQEFARLWQESESLPPRY